MPAGIPPSTDFVANSRRHQPAHPPSPRPVVETAEDEAISDPELTAIPLGLHNVPVSVDAFGVGHSSFGRLREIPFAELKLDRSFVDGCSMDIGKRFVCRTVADLAQGFLFAEPMKGSGFAAMPTARAKFRFGRPART